MIDQDTFQPSKDILRKYAQVLVQFALGTGEGVKPGEVVLVRVPDVAKPLGLALQRVILEAGAHPMIRLSPTGGFQREFLEFANEEQLTFFPEEYIQARVKLIDHQIGIIAEPDPTELMTVDPQKIMLAGESQKLYRRWTNEKEMRGQFSWTAALWGTAAKADIVGLTLEAYWQQIIQACYLDEEDPVARWQQINRQQQWLKKFLTEMEIQTLHIEGEEVDLKVQIGADRRWQSGSGNNIPSFEVFTSPDWRGTEGWIKFNQPLYRYGNVIKDIELKFEKGEVVHSQARSGQAVLRSMIATPGGNRLGEVSLTDERMSRITHVMAETLFDENITNNTHVALGMAYKDCYRYDQSVLTDDDWENKGFNDSSVHTDIISTSERQVTATLGDGSEQIIYANGRFTFWEEE